VNLAACEEAIRRQDNYVLKEAPRWVDLVVKFAEEQVEKNEATESLEALTSASCSRRELLYMLAMCENRGVTNALKMTGYESGDLKKKLRHLREASDIAARFNGFGSSETEFGKFLDMATDKNKSLVGKFIDLPTSLSEYVSLLEHSVKYLGGKADFYLSLAKAALDDFITKHTGQHYDSDVTCLLSVMLGPEYEEQKHRVWRSSYKKRLKNFHPDPSDSPSLREKKTLLECEAAIRYRMDVLHPGDKYLRQEAGTVLRSTDLA
jgi:hypothetical protein